MKTKALSAWRYVSSARQSGSSSAWRILGYLKGMAARHLERKSRQVIVVVAMKTKALSAWRYVSSARQSGSSSAWRILGYLKGMAARHLEVDLVRLSSGAGKNS
ncbi:hypothetical protein DEO72_LG6g902 [Vigna unguiculata]|uniref:Uncharacterized protein n=1 Tax=Vigna unguiculata TaxID=3917 RepID=A0A4D6M6B5_VIGUN|nr:hypothetical protein DEO72_LG6g902 [Vigna unguiculata]